MWSGLSDFSDTVCKGYRRDVWDYQPTYFEVWLEKDALSGIFEDLLNPYGVTLNVGRGYDGWDSIRNAAQRFNELDIPVGILYFGDFDPSGEDMVRSLKERLEFFECKPKIVKCALTFDDVTRYSLPPDFAKKTDTRAKDFIARYGDIAVELDALPGNVLRERLKEEVEARLDLSALNAVKELERDERIWLEETLSRES